jgi:DNA helicase II / ATP-dependent DNA helicase PcrA
VPVSPEIAREILTANLNEEQKEAVSSSASRLLVIAGAGSGKTEVMARRVAWWIAVENYPRSEIVAFTFTEAAAEELKFRIRKWLQLTASEGEEVSIGGMYIGTIHGFCLQALRELAPNDYYMSDVLDDAGRMSLIAQGSFGVLAMSAFEKEAKDAGVANGRYAAIDLFMTGYDLLNEYGVLDVTLPTDAPPADLHNERDWCAAATLNTPVGSSALNNAFAETTGRYYAYLRARRFFDFPTVQSELQRRLLNDADFAKRFHARWKALVVDEVQDINPVQDNIIRSIVGEAGRLTAVGDHRQAIYAFRGGRVDLMGRLFQELAGSENGEVLELPANYRSTQRIINLANAWSKTIQDTAGMSNPDMSHGNTTRVDQNSTHVALARFGARGDEANWIAESISQLVRPTSDDGAKHDQKDGFRGLKYSDVAILVRSATDVREYQNALRARDIPAVVRAGPDLFSQPEVLLVLAAFARAASVTSFFGGGNNPKALANRAQRVLNSSASTEDVIANAAGALRVGGISVPQGVEDRLVRLARAIAERCENGQVTTSLAGLACREAVRWLAATSTLRRVFPQTIFHWLLYEAGMPSWGESAAAKAALFHVGQISKLVKSIETSGWTPPKQLKWQAIALLQWGAGAAKAEEAPLLADLDAVSITTIHASKGLEFPVVFMADVNPLRFPSNQAKRVDPVPYDLAALPEVDPGRQADNPNYDGERRLMYVGLTRAERFLFITCSGPKTSPFVMQLAPIVAGVGGVVAPANAPPDIASTLEYAPSAFNRDQRFATSFSDIRYFMECPHDFYLRVVLGFTPTIGQEFGYGRGVHNLLRAVHADPAAWAALSSNPTALRDEVTKLQEAGLFYMRYTTGDPLDNLLRKASEGVVTYVNRYEAELSRVEYEPEKPFETLIPEENLLITGAIDVVRLDDPPRVTIIDFKSGDSTSENASGLTAELMGFQIGVYGLAAKSELEYDPQHGLVRYIGERDTTRAEMAVTLSDERLAEVRAEIVTVAKDIRDRRFDAGPSARRPDRCVNCDMLKLCPRREARATRVADGLPY